MYAWLKANRPETPSAGEHRAGAGRRHDDQGDVSDAGRRLRRHRSRSICGRPRKASAVMVRDSKGSHDGWFWGWYGWAGLGLGGRTGRPSRSSPYPRMGFGQYCTNCHASAKDNSTFAALKNIKGEPGEPLVFLSQNFFLDPSWQSLQSRIQSAGAKDAAERRQRSRLQPGLHRRSSARSAGRRRAPTSIAMPSETYDNVWAKAGRADRGEPVRHLGPVPRLPQRRRHRPAIRHDAAGPGRTS